MTMFSDQTLTCTECAGQFLFSAKEQQFFRDRGFTQPKRCQPCREKKKARYAMD